MIRRQKHAQWVLLLLLTLAFMARVEEAFAVSKPKAKTVDEVNSIEEYFGGDDAQKLMTKRVNLEIQKCMKRQGFDFVLPPETVPFPTETNQASQLEFAKRNGYGISTGATSGGVDPNAAQVAKMSPVDRAAYEKALLGGVGANPISDPKSCVSQAISSIGDISQLEALFGNYQKEVTAKINADPKVLQAMKKWAACMGEKGFVYTRDSDPPRVFRQKFTLLTGGSSFGGVGGAAVQTALAKPDFSKKLGDLQVLERDTAVQDVVCGQKFLKLRFTMKRDLDREFIRKNQTVLDKYRRLVTK